MSITMPDPRLDVPLRTAKVTHLRGEGALRKLKREAGEALELARAAAQIEPKAMAAAMGLSHSLVLRGLKSQDHLSFHRLLELPDAFWLELLIVIAKKRGIAVVRTTLEIAPERRSA